MTKSKFPYDGTPEVDLVASLWYHKMSNVKIPEEVQGKYTREDLAQYCKTIKVKEGGEAHFIQLLLASTKDYIQFAEEYPYVPNSIKAKQIKKLQTNVKRVLKDLEQINHYRSTNSLFSLGLSLAEEKRWPDMEHTEYSSVESQLMRLQILDEAATEALGCLEQGKEPKELPSHTLGRWVYLMCRSVEEFSDIKITPGHYYSGVGYVSDIVTIFTEIINKVDDSVTEQQIAEEIKKFKEFEPSVKF